MRRLLQAVTLGILFFSCGGISQAEYRKEPSTRSNLTEEETSQGIIDLKRYRKGNYEWDTQEMIAAGFNTLHRENQRILEELHALKTEIARLKEKK